MRNFPNRQAQMHGQHNYAESFKIIIEILDCWKFFNIINIIIQQMSGKNRCGKWKKT